MATTSPTSAVASSAIKAKLPVVPLLLAVVFAVWIGLAGSLAAVLFLVRSGKLRVPQTLTSGGTSKPAETRSLVLEPILVNLADEGGHAYLRLGLTLSVEGDAAAGAEPSSGTGTAAGTSNGKGASGAEGVVRDTVLTVLGRQTSSSLLGPDGKEHLKIELKEAIARSEPTLKVDDLYFSEFLVQI